MISGSQLKRYFYDVQIALNAILTNRLKSMLTALGIIFGVAAVISMLAIGKGTQQEILEQIKMVGVNNIVITPIVEEKEQSAETEENNKQKKKYSPGLTLQDTKAICEVLPNVQRISPEIVNNGFAAYKNRKLTSKIIGVANDYFSIYNLPLLEGKYFNETHEEEGLAVCIIGYNVFKKLFSTENAIDKYIKFGNTWLKVIGVLEKNNIRISGTENTGVNVMNDNIFIPAKTFLLRYKNRAVITSKKLENSNSSDDYYAVSSDPKKNVMSNYHQLDRVIVQVKETGQLASSAELLGRLMLRRHFQVKDFEITVPELLLKQQERTKDIFNIVLGAIASISLIVGGIGIMNIMFASVLERIKEIGTRMAIGANKNDIVVQFLSEAVLISVTGGILGIILGITISFLIQKFAGILTIVSFFSVFVAFIVSVSVGIAFGYVPAKRAAEKDPIEALRYE